MDAEGRGCTVVGAEELTADAESDAGVSAIDREVEIALWLGPKECVPFFSVGNTWDRAGRRDLVEKIEDGCELFGIGQDAFEPLDRIAEPARIQISCC